MRESVQLDLIGETHIDFDDRTFVYVRDGYSRIRLPALVNGRCVTTNRPVAYRDVQWIGSIVQRQWWLLAPGAFFGLLGPMWMIRYFGDWGAFAVSVVWFVGLGIFPFLLLAKGRTYLGIATADRITVLPMDRQRKKIARILGLLRQSCQSSDVKWELYGTSFDHPDSWDNRPATGKGFNLLRYVGITTLLGLYGLAGLLYNAPEFRPTAVAMRLFVVATALIWAIRAILRKLSSTAQD
jgi:hypothetical protein